MQLWSPTRQYLFLTTKLCLQLSNRVCRSCLDPNLNKLTPQKAFLYNLEIEMILELHVKFKFLQYDNSLLDIKNKTFHLLHMNSGVHVGTK